MRLEAHVGIACGVGGKRDSTGRVAHPNEDAVAALGCVVATQTPTRTRLATATDQPTMVLVADGLGGHAAGDRASREVALRLSSRAEWFRSPESVDAELGACHDLLRTISEREPDTLGMATTVAGLVIHQAKALVFNVGDSRVYRLNGNRIVQLSMDHGRTPVSAGSNVITRAIGTGTDEGSELSANQRLLSDLHDGDTFLLCSDGLSDFVATADIERVLRVGTDPVDIAHDLYRLAISAASNDNISVVALHLAAIEPADPPAAPAPETTTQKPKLSWRLRRKRQEKDQSPR